MNNRPAQANIPARSGGNNRPNNGVPAKSPAKKRNLILPILLVMAGCVVFLFAAWSAVRSPVLASILNGNSGSAQFQQRAPGESYAQVYLPKPTYMPPVDVQPVVQQPAATEAPQQQVIVMPPTDAPPTEAAAAEVVVVQPAATEAVVAAVSTGDAVAEAQIIPDTPTAEYVAPPTEAAYVPPAASGVVTGTGEHWFDVDLSDQRMYAYEGDTLVRTFIVSTGTWQTPTVTGKFKVWIKLKSAPMSGPGYYLPDVPYIMYFYKDYGIHGTYWHNNFGVPMSHGCVNLSIPDAEWAYNFASVGTVVNVHD